MPPDRALRLEDMLPEELARQIAAVPAVVVPFGTLEWHSHHLPIGLDSLVIGAVCERVAAGTGALLAPLVSIAAGGAPFPYTVQFPLPLVEQMALGLFRQLGAMGFKLIVALTGHYTLEQLLALKRAAAGCMADLAVTVYAGGEYELVTDLGFLGDHAGKWETSMLQALQPARVRLERLAAAGPEAGIYGDDPRLGASAALGAEILEAIVSRSQALCLRLLNATTPVERCAYLEALTALVRALEAMQAERGRRPKTHVPPLVTRAYAGSLQAFWAGDYIRAKQLAEAKWMDLSQ